MFILIFGKKQDEQVLDISVEGNLKEVDFCKEKGATLKKANLLAVTAEEILVNIIRYGGKG